MIMVSVSAISLTDKMIELWKKPDDLKTEVIVTEEKITHV